MNIWEAYCESNHYSVYFDIVRRQLGNKKQAENLKSQFQVYLQRIKETAFAQELSAINDRLEFKNKLEDIFLNKWSGHMKYAEMPDYFIKYLDFLTSREVIHNDFIDEQEKRHIVNLGREVLDGNLTPYETECMKDGKLFALMNPHLLHHLRTAIIDNRINPKAAAQICENFYEGILPAMTLEDYQNLVKKIWHYGGRVRAAGRNNYLQITFPDQSVQTLSVSDGLKKIIEYYTFDRVRMLGIVVRERKLLLNYTPIADRDLYEEFGKNQFIEKTGNAKDKYNIATSINRRLGGQLQIELVAKPL